MCCKGGSNIGIGGVDLLFSEMFWFNWIYSKYKWIDVII